MVHYEASRGSGAQETISYASNMLAANTGTLNKIYWENKGRGQEDEEIPDEVTKDRWANAHISTGQCSAEEVSVLVHGELGSP